MELLKLYVAHFLADFVLQTRGMASGKARFWRYMILHSLVLAAVTTGLFAGQITSAWPMVLVTVFFHALVDIFSARVCRPTWRVLVVDQAIHWISIPLILAVFDGLPWSRFGSLLSLLNHRTTLVLILGYAFSIFFGSVLVDRICDQFDLALAEDPQNRDAAARERGASTFIGFVERFLVTTFILFGQYGAVGYVFAAKSLGKFTEGGESPIRRRFPAYYLVGTLASFALALLAGLFMRWQLGRQVM